MSEDIRKRKDPDHKASVRRFILFAVSAAAVLVAALVDFFLPFLTWIPAETIPARMDGELRIHFLSVGQGDSTLVEFPDGACVLIDAGNGDFETDNHLYSYLKGIDMTSLQIVATHADSDHYGGIASVLKTFGAEKVWLPALSSENERYRETLKAAEGVQTETLNRYDVIAEHGGCYLVCVSPYSIGESDENDSSAVLWLSNGSTSALFAADITSARERRLMRDCELGEDILDCGDLPVRLGKTDILKVSHHGSATSSSEEWLKFLGADVAILSCGADNPYGHPAAAAVTRLARNVGRIYRTDELGDIMISVTDRGYTVHANGRSYE